MSYTVVVYYPGKGRYQGGDKVDTLRFKDERKARDYYTDMLLKYPDYNVEFLERRDMKIYEIEVLAIGTYTAVNPYDHSGCSDVDVDCWQEATITVAAESVEEAVKMISRDYEKLNRDWANSCDILYYNPVPLSVKEDEGDKPEILDYHFREPRNGDGATDAPERYSVEVTI